MAAGSLLTRFGVFEAGMASARDPKYTVVSQHERLAAREAGQQVAQNGHASTITRLSAPRVPAVVDAIVVGSSLHSASVCESVLMSRGTDHVRGDGVHGGAMQDRATLCRELLA